MKKYTVTVNGEEENFNSLEEARNYLIEVENGFIYSGIPGHLKITATDGDKKTEAHIETNDELWEVSSDDFELFYEGFLM